jgi:hypothetical protein
MQVVFLSHLIPKTYVRKFRRGAKIDNDVGLFFARYLHKTYANVTCVTDGLKEDRPLDKQVFAKRGILHISNDIMARSVSVIRFPVIHSLCRFWGFYRVLRHLYKKDQSLLVFTMPNYAEFTLPVLLMKHFHNNIVHIGFEASHFIESDWFKLFYAKPLIYLTKLGIRSFNGIIRLTPNYESFLRDVPSLRINYPFFDNKYIDNYAKSSLFGGNNQFAITYVGNLSKWYRLDYIINIIHQTGKLFSWRFAGTGPYVDQIKELSESSSYDVKYYGFLFGSAYYSLIASSDLNILFFDPDNQNLRYTSSAKIRDYLLAGRPILTNDVPGHPDEASPYLNFVGYSEDSFLTEVDRIRMNYSVYLGKAIQGQNVWKKVSDPIKIENGMSSFIAKVAKNAVN